MGEHALTAAVAQQDGETEVMELKAIHSTRKW
jgi:hypothetical protein